MQERAKEAKLAPIREHKIAFPSCTVSLTIFYNVLVRSSNKTQKLQFLTLRLGGQEKIQGQAPTGLPATRQPVRAHPQLEPSLGLSACSPSAPPLAGRFLQGASGNGQSSGRRGRGAWKPWKNLGAGCREDGGPHWLASYGRQRDPKCHLLHLHAA